VHWRRVSAIFARPAFQRRLRGIKSVAGDKSDDMANYDAQHADQIGLNRQAPSQRPYFGYKAAADWR
jgi:hypothetical protein